MSIYLFFIIRVICTSVVRIRILTDLGTNPGPGALRDLLAGGRVADRGEAPGQPRTQVGAGQRLQASGPGLPGASRGPDPSPNFFLACGSA